MEIYQEFSPNLRIHFRKKQKKDFMVALIFAHYVLLKILSEKVYLTIILNWSKFLISDYGLINHLRRSHKVEVTYDNFEQYGFPELPASLGKSTNIFRLRISFDQVIRLKQAS